MRRDLWSPSRAPRLAGDPRVVPKALAAVRALAERWQLTDDEASVLAGAGSTDAWRTWPGATTRVEPEVMARISCLMNVAVLLDRQVEGDALRAAAWWRDPAALKLTGGRSPLAFCLGEGVPGLLALMAHLRAPPGTGPS